MGFDEISRDRVARFWSAPNLARGPGLKAVDMFEAVHDGRIKALWIMATNPAVSLPNSARVREALARCPFVVVSDCMAETDTTACAQVKLPALAWGEKDGTVINSERCISRQRPILPPPGEARADWRIVADVASAMGFGEAFDWRFAASVFREHARLTAFENTARPLNLAPLIGLTPEQYELFEPVQWPLGGSGRLFSDGRFATPDGRARLVPVSPRPPSATTDGAFPFALNTGRVRDQWHTMTRTGLAPELCRHAPEPFVEIHPADAEAFGLTDGALTRVITAEGEAVVQARLTDRQRRGGLFMPMHWTDAFAPSGRANALVPAAADPVSGQPEFKHAPARIRAYRETWRGFFLARDAFALPEGHNLVWRRIPMAACQLHEFAGRGDEAERLALRRALTRRARGEVIAMEDPSAGAERLAYVLDGRLERVLFTTAGRRLPPRAWLAELFDAPALTPEARASLLHGQSLGARPDTSPLICACHGVSTRRIAEAVEAGATCSDAVGEATGAGTGCGACRPEIARIIRAHAPRKEVAHAA
jgi:assimilatory nitrate reductase catalytic subunit